MRMLVEPSLILMVDAVVRVRFIGGADPVPQAPVDPAVDVPQNSLITPAGSVLVDQAKRVLVFPL